jgi:tyrosine-protein kinase Etk/Wzc
MRPANAPERTAQGAALEDDGEIDLANLLAQVAARKWLIMAVVVLGGLVGAFIGQLDPVEYRAASVVQIEKRASGVPLPEELIGNMLTGDRGAQSSLATEVHIIRSRLILEPVVEQLGVDQRVEPVRAPFIGDLLARRSVPMLGNFLPAAYQRPEEAISLGSIEVPDSLLGVPFRLRVTGNNTYELRGPDGVDHVGKVGEELHFGDGIRVVVSGISAPPGRAYTLVREPVRKSVTRLRHGLAVTERGSTGIVDFRYTSGNPAFSHEVVNAVVASYRQRNLRRRSAEIDQSIEFIETQLPQIRAELGEATAELAEYRQEQEGMELSFGTQDLLDRLVAIQTRLEELAFEEEQLAQRLTPNHPDYQKLIAERQQLQSRLEETRENLRDVPEAEQELARFKERVAGARELEKQLTARVEQLRVLKASTVGNIRVLEQAEVASSVGPDRQRPALFGGGLGLVGAVAFVLGMNLLRRGVEDARDIEALGLSVFGSVNKVPALTNLKSSAPAYALALHEPDNIAAEALRGLRTGLQFSLSANDATTVMITSCAPSDGKSFISLNLAIVHAQTGARVLLIDADMRRGKLGRCFGISRRDPGLATVLAGEAELADCVYADPASKVAFLGTGGYPPNPAELLAGARFSDILRRASEHYDIVIVDAPPALAVADPSIIGQQTDVTLMVVRHLVTAKAELQSALKSLETAGVVPSGAVVNAYDVAKSRYGQYGSRYGHHYGAYRYKYKA